MSEAMIYEIDVEFERDLTEKELDAIRHEAKNHGYNIIRVYGKNNIYLKNTEAVRGGGREAIDDLYEDLFEILPPSVLPAIKDIHLYATYIEQAPCDHYDTDVVLERIAENIEQMAEDKTWKEVIESKEWNGVKFWFDEQGRLQWNGREHDQAKVFKALMEIIREMRCSSPCSRC